MLTQHVGQELGERGLQRRVHLGALVDGGFAHAIASSAATAASPAARTLASSPDR